MINENLPSWLQLAYHTVSCSSFLFILLLNLVHLTSHPTPLLCLFLSSFSTYFFSSFSLSLKLSPFSSFPLCICSRSRRGNEWWHWDWVCPMWLQVTDLIWLLCGGELAVGEKSTSQTQGSYCDAMGDNQKGHWLVPLHLTVSEHISATI